MNLTDPHHGSAARFALAGFGAAAAWAADSVVQITSPPFDGEFTTTVDYLHEVLSAAALALTAVALAGLARTYRLPRRPVSIAITGLMLVVAGIVAGIPVGESGAWFAAFGIPGVLLWLIGTLLVARSIWTTDALPRWVAVAIALTAPVSLVLADIGGGLATAILWIYLASRVAGTQVAANAS